MATVASDATADRRAPAVLESAQNACERRGPTGSTSRIQENGRANFWRRKGYILKPFCEAGNKGGRKCRDAPCAVLLVVFCNYCIPLIFARGNILGHRERALLLSQPLRESVPIVTFLCLTVDGDDLHVQTQRGALVRILRQENYVMTKDVANLDKK